LCCLIRISLFVTAVLKKEAAAWLTLEPDVTMLKTFSAAINCAFSAVVKE
jgi:hypothetical protein